MSPYLAAAALGCAFAVGAASGAGTVKLWADREIASLKSDHAEKMASGYEAAMKVNHDTQARADAVRDQLVRSVRLCSRPPAAGVPGAGAGPAVGDLPGGGTDRDYGPALRELLAAAIANRRGQ